MNISFIAIQGWHTEAGREAIIGFTCGVFTTIIIGFFARIKIVKPAKKHHDEAMVIHKEIKQMHTETHEHLGIKK